MLLLVSLQEPRCRHLPYEGKTNVEDIKYKHPFLLKCIVEDLI